MSLELAILFIDKEKHVLPQTSYTKEKDIYSPFPNRFQIFPHSRVNPIRSCQDNRTCANVICAGSGAYIVSSQKIVSMHNFEKYELLLPCEY
jgi:hypothetical protein